MTETMKPSDIKVGDILHTSWGYDMTMNDYAVVQQNTGKTLLCQICGSKSAEEHGFDGYQGQVKPDPTRLYGKPFRVCMKVKHSKYNDTDWFSLSGSYPFCAHNGNDDSKRLGYWGLVDKDSSHWENHMD